jgi:hypothetical protein
MNKTYKSKVSYSLLAFVFAVFYGPLIPNVILEGFNFNILVLILILSIVFAFIVHVFLQTRYIIKNDMLIIKVGFFEYRPIDIQQIKEISSSNSLISSPAPSFDRIEIKYAKFDSVLISPLHKTAFVNDLISINPTITNKVIS